MIIKARFTSDSTAGDEINTYLIAQGYQTQVSHLKSIDFPVLISIILQGADLAVAVYQLIASLPSSAKTQSRVKISFVCDCGELLVDLVNVTGDDLKLALKKLDMHSCSVGPRSTRSINRIKQ